MLPLETFEAVIEEAVPLGLTAVKLTGGEPLMHPQIKEILEIIRREDLRLVMETNALLATPELCEDIARSPHRFISVSIDGADEETHDYVRNIPGSFKLSVQGIKNLIDSGTPPQIIMSVMRCNAHQIDDLVHWAEDLGVESVKFKCDSTDRTRGETSAWVGWPERKGIH